jgi:hypothetical protein
LLKNYSKVGFNVAIFGKLKFGIFVPILFKK